MQEGVEMLREGGADFDPGASAWLGETELCSVKKIAAERGQSDLADLQLGGCAIKRVAYDGMMKGGEVHADLVRAAGVKLDFDERGGVDASKGAPVRAGFAGVSEDDAAAGGHADAAFRITADGQIDAAMLSLQKALHQGDVGFLNGALAEGFTELGVGLVIFRYQDYAGGIFVEAMDDSGAQGVTRLRKSLATTEQGIDERAASVSGAGMDGHASGLVDDDYVVVFVEDFERDGFGFGAERRAGLYFDREALAAAQALRAFCGVGVEKDQPGFD